MNQRLFSVLIFAFVVSAGASLLLYRLIASRVTANAKQPTTQVLVAARTMELGTLIRDSDVKMADFGGTLPHLQQSLILDDHSSQCPTHCWDRGIDSVPKADGQDGRCTHRRKRFLNGTPQSILDFSR